MYSEVKMIEKGTVVGCSKILFQHSYRERGRP